LFADDTTLLLSNPDINLLMLEANAEFHKIVNFFRLHKLALHPDKTKFMIFSNSNAVKNMDLNLFINFNNSNENLQDRIFAVERISNKSKVTAIRFLGVYFDPNLNFDFHIKLVISKLSKALFILRTSKNLLSMDSLKSIYYTLFHCHLVYCLPIWSSTTMSNLKPIIKMQKAAIRILANKSYNAHTGPLFKKLNILPFTDLVKFFNLQFMQRYIQGFLPISFRDVWLTNEARRNQDNVNIVLRNSENLHIPFARLSSSLRQPYVLLPKLWSDFTQEDIKIVRNKLDFNLKLKKFMLDELPTTVNCRRLFCPACTNIL
jgi:hypothetical protein